MENVFNSIEQATANTIKAEQGDYVLDGLLHCGKCHTPKQCKIELFGAIKTPYCLCRCETEKRDAEEAERKRIEFEKQVLSLRKAGFAEVEMQKWNFANDDGENEHVTQIMLKYVENFKEFRKNGKGLLLYGEVGTGKTYAAACVANALIDKGYPCLVTNFARLTNTISGMYAGKQEYIDGLNKFSLLVIDDLASERDTEFMGEIVQNIIDSRYRVGLPLIVTTNLKPNELQNTKDLRKQRIYSRLFEMTLPVEVKGKDRRREKLKDDYSQYKCLLGLE